MWNVVVIEVVLCIFHNPVHREESISKNNKRITMVQNKNSLRKDNNQSIRVIFEALHLAELGPTVGIWCQMSDKILVNDVVQKC